MTLTLWDDFLHWLWKRVGEPGMQCHGPHVHPGDTVTVIWTNSRGRACDEWTGVVNSVRGDRVDRIVLREISYRSSNRER